MALPQRFVREFRGAIEKVLALDYESFWELASALKDAPRTIVPDMMALELASRVKTIPREDIEEIMPALLSFCSLRQQLDSSMSEVVEDISRAIDADDEDLERIKDRFTELLGIDSLNVIAKSGSLLVNHERFMQRVQILTDIRPVFGSDPNDRPRAAVITYALRLIYHESGEVKHLFIAMDTNDVRELSEQIERANSKAASLKSVLAAAEVPYVDDEFIRGEGEGDAT